MNWTRTLQARRRALLRKRQLDADMNEEMRSHIELRTQANIDAGMSPEQARLGARRRFGCGESIKEHCREQRGVPWLENLVQDIRFGARQLRKNRGFTTVAVLTLALGIGANTAIFSIVNTLLFRPLPFRQPERLVWIANGTSGDSGLSGVTTRVNHFVEWRRENQSYESLSAYFAFFDYGSYTLTSAGEPVRLQGVGVSENFLTSLGIQPQLGRNFVVEECQFNGRKAVLLTDGFWRRRFNADRGIVGRTIVLNNEPNEVIGVLPPSFDF